jgi:hypothetical protein
MEAIEPRRVEPDLLRVRVGVDQRPEQRHVESVTEPAVPATLIRLEARANRLVAHGRYDCRVRFSEYSFGSVRVDGVGDPPWLRAGAPGRQLAELAGSPAAGGAGQQPTKEQWRTGPDLIDRRQREKVRAWPGGRMHLFS